MVLSHRTFWAVHPIIVCPCIALPPLILKLGIVPSTQFCSFRRLDNPKIVTSWLQTYCHLIFHSLPWRMDAHLPSEAMETHLFQKKALGMSTMFHTLYLGWTLSTLAMQTSFQSSHVIGRSKASKVEQRCDWLEERVPCFPATPQCVCPA